MLIWVLAVVLVGGFGLIGHQAGSIRSGIGLVGVGLGLALAGVLDGLVGAGLSAMGVTDQIALRLLAGPMVFLVFTALFYGIGVAVHRPVEHHFKYRTDEPPRQAFERTTQATGLFVGLITGICVFFSVGGYVFRQGYLVVQTTNEAGEATPVRYIGQIRQDMDSTGWSKAFAALDSTPAKFYEVSDILGLLHANPLVHGRVENYPPFLALAEAPEFAEIGSDQDYQKLLQDQAPLSAMINHPKTLAVLGNTAHMETFAKLDLKDFRQYLETGTSPRYEDEKILGRWRMDPGAVLTSLKRQRLNASPLEMKKLREALTPVLGGISLIAYPDGRFTVNMAAAPAPEAAPVDPANGGQPEAGQDPSAVRNSYLARYGLPAGAPAAPAPAAAPRRSASSGSASMAIPELKPIQGTWIRAGGRYQLQVEGGADKETLDALVNDTGRLTWTQGSGDKKISVFFVRTS